jgi:hypothetical protein
MGRVCWLASAGKTSAACLAAEQATGRKRDGAPEVVFSSKDYICRNAIRFQSQGLE